MHSNYELVIEAQDPAMRTVVPFRQFEISIGRKPGNTILLGEHNVSRYHARLIRARDAVEIEDLNSYNGILLNGQRIAGRALLKESDQIQIGDYRLALRRVEQATAAAPTQIALKPPSSLRTLQLSQAPGRQSSRHNRRVWMMMTMAGLGLIGGLLLTQRSVGPRLSKPAAPISTQAPHPRGKNPQPACPSPAPSERRDVPGTVQIEQQRDTASRLRRHNARPQSQDHEETRPMVTTKAPAAAASGAQPSQGAAQLEQAQAHYIHGEFAAAIRVARGLTTRPGPGVDQTRAWRLLGAASCRLGDLELLNEAYRRVDAVSRQFLQYVCQQSNVTRNAGRFELAR